MAEVEIRAGAKVDLATRTEMRSDLEDVTRAFDQERERNRARGKKYFRQYLPVNAVSWTSPPVPTGYSWLLLHVGCNFPGAGNADNLTILLGETVPTTAGVAGSGTLFYNPNGQVYQAAAFGTRQIVLFQGDRFTVAGINGKTIGSVLIAYIETPGEMLYKVLD